MIEYWNISCIIFIYCIFVYYCFIFAILVSIFVSIIAIFW